LEWRSGETHQNRPAPGFTGPDNLVISQRMKDLYWAAAAGLSVINLHYQRAVRRIGPTRLPLLVNLGSGPQYIEGFVNVDGNPFQKKDLWLDIRFGLPFSDGSVSAIYMCHVLEHFAFPAAQKILRECQRVLAAEGGIRIVVPSLEKAVEAFVRRDADWFFAWPDRYESLGGRFNNFLLCRDQHRLMFDSSLMRELLVLAGFCSFETRCYRVSGLFPPDTLHRMEDAGRKDLYDHSLIVEALKTRS
jgi:predicted SAM-dependent methyltransferase